METWPQVYKQENITGLETDGEHILALSDAKVLYGYLWNHEESRYYKFLEKAGVTSLRGMLVGINGRSISLKS